MKIMSERKMQQTSLFNYDKPKEEVEPVPEIEFKPPYDDTENHDCNKLNDFTEWFYKGINCRRCNGCGEFTSK